MKTKNKDVEKYFLKELKRYSKDYVKLFDNLILGYLCGLFHIMASEHKEENIENVKSNIAYLFENISNKINKNRRLN